MPELGRFFEVPISKDQLQRGWQAILDRKSKLYELHQQVAANRSQQRNTASDLQLAELDSSSKVNGLFTAKAELNRQRVLAGGENEYLLKAPIAGRIANLRVSQGAFVNEKAILLNILPERSGLDAELMVPANVISEVKIGQAVVLVYDSMPFERYGSFRGKVDYIAKLPIAGAKEQNLANEATPAYLVRVKAVGPPESARKQHSSLQLGTTLTAKIVLGNESIFGLLTTLQLFDNY